MTEQTLARWLAPITRKLRLLVSRAVVSLSDDRTLLQALQFQLLAGETAERVERFQEYGFTSRPLAGAEAIAAAIGGARGHLVAVAVDDRRHRKTDMESGEVALYTDEGDYIHLRRGRIIYIKSGAKVHIDAPEIIADCDTATVHASASAKIDTPETTLTGNLTVGGTVTATGDVTGAGISLDHHVHGGVKTGGGNTGAPI